MWDYFLVGLVKTNRVSNLVSHAPNYILIMVCDATTVPYFEIIRRCVVGCAVVSRSSYLSFILKWKAACKPVVTCSPPAASVHLLVRGSSGCFLSTGDKSCSDSHICGKKAAAATCSTLKQHLHRFFWRDMQSQELTHRGVDAKGMLLCQVFVDIRSLAALVTVTLSVFTRIWLSVTQGYSCSQTYSVRKLKFMR